MNERKNLILNKTRARFSVRAAWRFMLKWHAGGGSHDDNDDGRSARPNAKPLAGLFSLQDELLQEYRDIIHLRIEPKLESVLKDIPQVPVR